MSVAGPGPALAFQNFVLLLGNGATPEVFTAVAACTSRGHDFKTATGSTDVPDSADDGALMTTELEAKAVTHQISFDGVCNMASQFTSLRAWADGSANGSSTKNVQILYNVPLAQGGGTYQGPALMTSFKVSGKKAEKSTFSGTIDSAGAWTFTAAVA